jgi:hypothetical protein
MITQAVPLAVGNAVQIVVSLPATAIHWRVLRNATGAFPSYNDLASTLVHDANTGDPLQFIDASNLVNGQLTYYQSFQWDGAAWSTDGPALSATPATTYLDESADAQSIVRDRVAVGIAAEIARGALNPVAGSIAVLLAPPTFEDTRWPVISVHMQSESPAQRALGEAIANDEIDTFTEQYDDHEGWLAKTQLQVIGWSLNADERVALRKAIRRIIVANLPVFDADLLLQVEFSQSDIEDFSTYSAPVYETVGTFSCLTPITVNVPGPAITDVESTVIPSGVYQ